MYKGKINFLTLRFTMKSTKSRSSRPSQEHIRHPWLVLCRSSLSELFASVLEKSLPTEKSQLSIKSCLCFKSCKHLFRTSCNMLTWDNCCKKTEITTNVWKILKLLNVLSRSHICTVKMQLDRTKKVQTQNINQSYKFHMAKLKEKASVLLTVLVRIRMMKKFV